MHHDDVLGEEVFEGQAREIRTVVLWLCGQEGNRFPGSQPVSLARDNMAQLSRQEYHVTWKADGTRYMLLLMRDGVYLIDRKFAVRRVTMRFSRASQDARRPPRTTPRCSTGRWWWTTWAGGNSVVDFWRTT